MTSIFRPILFLSLISFFGASCENEEFDENKVLCDEWHIYRSVQTLELKNGVEIPHNDIENHIELPIDYLSIQCVDGQTNVGVPVSFLNLDSTANKTIEADTVLQTVWDVLSQEKDILRVGDRLYSIDAIDKWRVKLVHKDLHPTADTLKSLTTTLYCRKMALEDYKELPPKVEE